MRRLALVAALAAASIPCSRSIAQQMQTPFGGNQAGRPSDTGTGGTVNAAGGYSSSLPIDAPPGRGGIPVPAAVVYGSTRMGAAGVGWDVPLAYIHRDRSVARSRPLGSANGQLTTRQRLTMVLGGAPSELIGKGSSGTLWMPRREGELVEVTDNGGGVMTATDGNGFAYRFTADGATPGSTLLNGDFMLLRDITGPGGNRVHLDYAISAPSLPGGVGLAIDLTRVSYNSHPSTAGCFKNQIAFTYNPDSPTPYSMSPIADQVAARMHTLAAVEVRALASCGATPSALRTYKLTYQPDQDTTLPRLVDVRVFGRAGTKEATTSIPVASYTYGSIATRTWDTLPSAIALPLPAGGNPDRTRFISGSVRGSDGYNPQNLLDLNGDGRPDLVFNSGWFKEGTLSVAFNRPAAATALQTPGAVAPTPAVTFDSPRSMSATTFSPKVVTGSASSPAPAIANWNDPYTVHSEDVWQTFMDVNGDGRIDYIDAHMKPDTWVIFLNTPASSTGTTTDGTNALSASGIAWTRLEYSIVALRGELTARGLGSAVPIDPDYLPIERQISIPVSSVTQCWSWDGVLGWTPSLSTSPCSGQTLPSSIQPGVPYNLGQASTVLWRLADLNGDGYPDVAMSSSPPQPKSTLEDLQNNPQPPFPNHRGASYQYLTVKFNLVNDDANRIDVMFNVRGVTSSLLGPTRPWSDPITVRSSPCGVESWRSGTRECGFDDINGDGVPERIEHVTTTTSSGPQRNWVAYLGLGAAYSTVNIAVPESPYGTLAVAPELRNNLGTECSKPPPGQVPTSSTSWLSGALRDLNGDGIPDNTNGYLGTGVGFVAAPRLLASPSSGIDDCHGAWFWTTKGLYDLDGDGIPEQVSIDNGALTVKRLGGALGARDSARLTTIANGFGAVTTINYTSAKDHLGGHDVPSQEIVVDSEIASAPSGSLAATVYAYGKAGVFFDPIGDHWQFTGYQRSIAATTTVDPTKSNRPIGMATVTDTLGADLDTSIPDDSVNGLIRWGRFLLVGRPKDVTTIVFDPTQLDVWRLIDESSFVSGGSSAWATLGNEHYEWTFRAFQGQTTSPQIGWCSDVRYPYNYDRSVASSQGAIDACNAHGFAYPSSVQTTRFPGAGI